MNTSFVVAEAILEETAQALQSVSFERTALWQLAEPEDGSRRVVSVVVPAQAAEATVLGHLVHVAGDELARIQFEAHRGGRRTWIQLHTHPSGDVAMSPLDRRWAIADFPGALSIILPRFGRDGLTGFLGVAVHERGPRGWRRWSNAERTRRLVVS